MKFRLTILVAAVVLAAFAGARPAAAIPAYARQMGVTCTQCHTVWPRLNAFGRQFKVKGYIDRSELGKTDFPFAVRVKVDATSETDTAPGTPNQTSRVINAPDEFNFFVGAPFFPKLGSFVEITGSRVRTSDNSSFAYDIEPDNLKFAYNTGVTHPASVVFFKGNIFAADPFPSGGGLDRPMYSTGDVGPEFWLNGLLTVPSDTGDYGLVYHTYFGKDNTWYGAGGLELGGSVDGSVGINRITSQSPKIYLRVARDQPLGENGGSWNLGAAYLHGSEQIQLPSADLSSTLDYTAKTDRLFVDGALELPLGKDGQNLFQAVGTFTSGRDTNLFNADPVAGFVGPFSQGNGGLYLETDYWWRQKYGVIASYDTSQIPTGLNAKTIGVGLAWNPQIDFRIAANAFFRTLSDNSKQTFYGLFFTKYFYKSLNDVGENAEKAQPSPAPQTTPSPQSAPSPPPH